jgi:hypothetical protein
MGVYWIALPSIAPKGISAPMPLGVFISSLCVQDAPPLSIDAMGHALDRRHRRQPERGAQESQEVRRTPPMRSSLGAQRCSKTTDWDASQASHLNHYETSSRRSPHNKPPSATTFRPEPMAAPLPPRQVRSAPTLTQTWAGLGRPGFYTLAGSTRSKDLEWLAPCDCRIAAAALAPGFGWAQSLPHRTNSTQCVID